MDEKSIDVDSYWLCCLGFMWVLVISSRNESAAGFTWTKSTFCPLKTHMRAIENTNKQMD